MNYFFFQKEQMEKLENDIWNEVEKQLLDNKANMAKMIEDGLAETKAKSEAIELYAGNFGRDNRFEKIELLKRAIELDPAKAAFWNSLFICYGHNTVRRKFSKEEIEEKKMEAINHAIALAPEGVIC